MILGVLRRVHLGEDALMLLEAKAMHQLSISANGMASFLVATPRYWGYSPTKEVGQAGKSRTIPRRIVIKLKHGHSAELHVERHKEGLWSVSLDSHLYVACEA